MQISRNPFKPISSSEIRDTFTLGSSNANAENIEALQRVVFEELSHCFNEVSENYESNKDFYRRLGFLPSINIRTTSRIPAPKSFSSLLLPDARLAEDSIEESYSAYSARLYYDIGKLEEPNAVGQVIVPLSKRIEELGFPCNIVEIRVERASLFPSNTLSWHYDGEAASTSIIVSFSNNPDWSTRLVDEKSKEQIVGKKERLEKETHLIKQLDDKAERASLGLLYNAKTTFHRAPNEADFMDGQIKAQDWRIFLQFMVNEGLEKRD